VDTLYPDRGQLPEPHAERRRALLKDHPELRSLIGPAPITGVAILLLVTAQTIAAALVAQQSWWVILILAYTVGATANLGCWALIHEASHNLVSRSSTANRWWSFIANLPILVPAAAHFRFWHGHHHKRQGDVGWDVDLPMPVEISLVGDSPFRKAIWLSLFMPLQVVRAHRAAVLPAADRWMWTNIGTTLLYAGLLAWLAGPAAVLYLLLSSWSAMGLHPFGARWVQEHFTLRGNQETTSYYGRMNPLLFNCGFHNEHHDLPGVPWHHLPRIRRAAPEMYEGLYATRSWSALLWRFLTDRQLTLGNRVLR
jgi:sphingolipid 4-desaturase/C4-monooxygenase